MSRPVLAAALAAAALAAIHLSAAAAATQPPSLWAVLQRTDALSARLDGARAQLRAARVDIRRSAVRLERASERVARLQAQGGTLRYAARGHRPAQHWLHHPRLVLTSGYRAAVTALEQAQREAAAIDGFPRLAAAQRRIDRLSAARRRDRALADALSGAAVPTTGIGQETREQWATALLQAVDAPVCANNLISLVTWQTAENTTAAWNPLATTQPAPGTTDYNSVGVKNYPSPAAGIAATVATLRGGYVTQGYGWILYRLATCADPDVTAGAINRSNWCRGCAGGAYVTGMVDEVRADYAAYAAG